MRVEPGVCSDAEKAASKATAAAQKPQAPHATRRPGRPQGRTNTHKAPRTLPPELVRITAMLEALLRLSTTVLSGTSLVLEGHFGTHTALQRARQCNVPLIAKLRCDAALSFPSTGPYAGRGPRRTYGRTVDDANRPETSRTHTSVDGHSETRLSQAHLLHKACAHLVHVVIMAKTTLRTQARAPVLLCRSDRERASARLVDYDGLRCHIEVLKG